MDDSKKVINELLDVFPEIFSDAPKFSLKNLPSKKNLVYHLKFNSNPKNLPIEIVIKISKNYKAEKEYDIIKRLEKQHLSVPKALYFKQQYLILEKVHGDNLCDFVNNNLIGKNQLNDLNSNIRSKVINSIKLLANWIAQMHKNNLINRDDFEITLNKGDTRLKDYIVNNSDNLLFGVDFEDSYEGNYHDDLAWICCALIDTNPGLFEMSEPIHKIELINIFLNEYYRINKNFHFAFNYFAEQLIENLNIVIKRRHLDFSIRKSSILKTLITDVRK